MKPIGDVYARPIQEGNLVKKCKAGTRKCVKSETNTQYSIKSAQTYSPV